MSSRPNDPEKKPQRPRRPQRVRKDARRKGNRRREAPVVAITTDDEPKEAANIVERITDQGPGLLFSLAVHGMILIAMAWYTYHMASRSELDTIAGGWLKPRGPNRNSLKPVRIDSFTMSDDAPKRKKARPGEETGSANPAVAEKPPVQPVRVDDLFKNRTPEKAEQLIIDAGGNERVMRTINLALGWLKRQQQSAGNWKLHEGYPDPGLKVIRTDTGATALALLPFLGAGHTHQSGDYQELVGKGLSWLKGIQKSDGNFHDHDELGRQTAFYAHSLATIAVCEALAMTSDESLREPAEQAVAFLLASQQPVTGGWKYRPLDQNSVADLSVTGWALMALHTARAAGIEVPLEPFQRASMFLESVSEQDGERYKYEPTDPANRVSVAMTAEGFLCRLFLGAKKDDEAISTGLNDYLLSDRNRPKYATGRRNVYEWYYVGHVLHNAADSEFKQWYSEVAKALVDNQAKSGSVRRGRDIRGSWSPIRTTGAPHEYSQKAGRLYLVCLSSLVLELPFRHQSVK